MRKVLLLGLLLSTPAFAEDVKATEDAGTDPILNIMGLNEISPAAGLGNSILPARPTSKDDARSLYFDLQAVSSEGEL